MITTTTVPRGFGENEKLKLRLGRWTLSNGDNSQDSSDLIGSYKLETKFVEKYM
jgi:hypothetical protein